MTLSDTPGPGLCEVTPFAATAAPTAAANTEIDDLRAKQREQRFVDREIDDLAQPRRFAFLQGDHGQERRHQRSSLTTDH